MQVLLYSEDCGVYLDGFGSNGTTVWNELAAVMATNGTYFKRTQVGIAARLASMHDHTGHASLARHACAAWLDAMFLEPVLTHAHKHARLLQTYALSWCPSGGGASGETGSEQDVEAPLEQVGLQGYIHMPLKKKLLGSHISSHVVVVAPCLRCSNPSA